MKERKSGQKGGFYGEESAGVILAGKHAVRGFSGHFCDTGHLAKWNRNCLK